MTPSSSTRKRFVFMLTLGWAVVLGGGALVLAGPDPAPDAGAPKDIPICLLYTSPSPRD